MKPTPISQFRTVTTSRVLPPKPAAKPPAYIARLQQHIAIGRTPAQAMALIEKEDGHRKSLPFTKLHTTTADMILPRLTHEWQVLTPAFCELVGAAHDTIRMSLKMMITAGLVEQRKTMINKPSQWRLK